MSGRRAEVKGGTRWRMDMVFRWVRLELFLGLAWTSWARFSGARALGGSSTRRLGGLTDRQLTGPVAEAPEVNLRSSAASHHQAKLGRGDAQAELIRIPRAPRGALAFPLVVLRGHFFS